MTPNQVIVLATPVFLLLIAIALVFFGAFPDEGRAFWGSTGKLAPIIAKISKAPEVLPNDEIVGLARLASEAKGTAGVGEELGRLNLPNEVLEDAFLRIAVARNETLCLAQNQVRGLGLESHAILRGDVAAHIAGAGTTAHIQSAPEDAGAFHDLRVVPAVFRAD